MDLLFMLQKLVNSSNERSKRLDLLDIIASIDSMYYEDTPTTRETAMYYLTQDG